MKDVRNSFAQDGSAVERQVRRMKSFSMLKKVALSASAFAAKRSSAFFDAAEAVAPVFRSRPEPSPGASPRSSALLPPRGVQTASLSTSACPPPRPPRSSFRPLPLCGPLPRLRCLPSAVSAPGRQTPQILQKTPQLLSPSSARSSALSLLFVDGSAPPQPCGTRAARRSAALTLRGSMWYP